MHGATVKKMPEQDFDHLPACSAEVQNDWSFTATAPVCLLAWES